MRSVFLIIGLFIGQCVWATTFESRLTRSEVYANESFQLVLSIDKNEKTAPDFTILDAEFNVSSVSRSSQMTVVNGETKSLTQWTIDLQPKKVGVLLIPAFSLDGLSSASLAVKVKPASALPQSTADKNVFLQVQVKPTGDVYPHQQITYSVKMYYSLPATITNPSLTAPDAKDVEIKQLPGEQHYRVDYEGRDYGVLEIHYALFPQHAGKLVIEPPTLSAVDISNFGNMQQRMFNPRGNRVHLSAHSVELDVLPESIETQNDWWVPATSVSLTEAFSGDTNNVHVGDAITRTISLVGEGVMYSQLPDIKIKANASFNVYPDKPKLEDSVVSNIIVGHRTQTFAIVPNEAGKLVLPEIKIPWWNVISRKAEQAVLPEKTINILPALPGATVSTPRYERQIALPPPVPVKPLAHLNRWFYLSVVLAGVWLGTLALWFYTYKKKLPVAPGNNKRNNKSNNIKKSLLALKRASKNNDSIACKKMLLVWAQDFWPKDKPQGLGSIAELLACEKFSQEIDRLESLLYKNDDGIWLGTEFWSAFQEALAQYVNANKEAANGLPELYE